MTARRADALDQLVTDINKEVGEGVKIHPVKLDVSKAHEVSGFVDALPASFKDVDVLVNNA